MFVWRSANVMVNMRGGGEKLEWKSATYGPVKH